MDRGIAVGRVDDVPVARGELRQDREDRVAPQTHARHGRQLVELVEAVALRVVGFAREQRRDERRQQLGSHLPVAVDLHEDRRALVERGTVAGDDGTADALVRRLPDHADARILAPVRYDIARMLGTRIVDHVDEPAFRPDPANDTENAGSNAIARDDDGDARGVRGPRRDGGRNGAHAFQQVGLDVNRHGRTPLAFPHRRSGALPDPGGHSVREREAHADPGSPDDHRSALRGTSPEAPPAIPALRQKYAASSVVATVSR